MLSGPRVVFLVALSLGAAASCHKENAPPPRGLPPPIEPSPSVATAPAPKADAGKLPSVASRVAVAVTDRGFVPNRIEAKAGTPITLVITRKTDRTCAREILFAGQEGKTPLPLQKTVEVTYTPKASGEVKFGCAMGMMVGGVLLVND